MNKRIEWIDIAKGLAIVLMVLSHGMRGGSIARDFIFSFHMPLLLSISGYTMKPAEDKESLIRNIKKDFKKLIGYYFLLAFIAVVLQFIFANRHNLDTIIRLLKHQITALFWGSGIGIYNYPPIGMIWFLISLFTAKTIINITHYLMNNNKFEAAIYMFMTMIGIILPAKNYYLPLNFDVSLVCVFFVYIGMVYRKYEEYLDKNAVPLLIFATIIHGFILSKNIVLDISGRTYGGYTVCLLLAMLGEYMAICLSKALVETKYIKRFLIFMGVNTLSVLLIHYEDFIIIGRLNIGFGVQLTIIRTLIVIPAAIIYILIKNYIKKKFLNKS